MRVKSNKILGLLVFVTFLSVFSLAETSLAYRDAIFNMTVIVEDAATGQPIPNASVETSSGGIHNFNHRGLTNSNGTVCFTTNMGPFQPNELHRFPSVGTTGRQGDVSVSRVGYLSNSGSGFFSIDGSHGPVIIRLTPERPPHNNTGSYSSSYSSSYSGSYSSRTSGEKKLQVTESDLASEIDKAEWTE